MLRCTGHLLMNNKILHVNTFSSFPCCYGMKTVFKDTYNLVNISYSMNVNWKTDLYRIRRLIPCLKQFSTSKIVQCSKTVKSHQYKELDVEKLLGSVKRGGKIELKVKDRKVAETRMTQVREGITKASVKTLSDWKSFFVFLAKNMCFFTITLVPTSIIWCWYSPEQRIKTAKHNPYFSKIIDLILEPMDDDMKSKAGLDVEEVKNLYSEDFLKNNASSFRDSVIKNLKENTNDESSTPEKL